MQRENVTHGFGPYEQPDSTVLILGSFPSVKSREAAFFYGHPQNRFWPLLALLYGQDHPATIEEKKAFLKKNRIALYDVIESCSIIGSSDSSIADVEPADLPKILEHCPKVRLIITNGKTAGRLYEKYQASKISVPMVTLPSTSPANAVFTMEKLRAAWGEYLPLKD